MLNALFKKATLNLNESHLIWKQKRANILSERRLFIYFFESKF